MSIPQVVHNNLNNHTKWSSAVQHIKHSSFIGFYHLSKWTNLQYHSFIIIKNMTFC